MNHGYQNTGGNAKNNYTPETWISEMAQALRDKDPNANIIVTDWESGSKPFLPLVDYSTAAGNTREVGNQLAQYLRDQGVDPNKTELIGHSLGAHVSGVAGDQFRQLTGNLIDRIVGLDPAGPEFTTRSRPIGGELGTGVVEEPVPPSDRLDPTDAKEVIAVHSAPNTLGYKDPIGTKDIHFNKNQVLQPGALTSIDNHGYAYKGYTELIKGESFYQADGSKFDIEKFYSPETGRIDIDTTKQPFTGSITGTFEGGSNKFSLGTPEFASFVQFDGKPFSTWTDTRFDLGKLTYKNGETEAGSAPTGDIPLEITLSVTQPESSPQTFNFVVKNQVTENTTGDAVLDADRLLFSGAGLSQERIKVAGVEYTLDLFGFTSDDGKSTVGQFDSPENSTADANLLGKIVPVTYLVTDLEQ